jgi:hypothetical protein
MPTARWKVVTLVYTAALMIAGTAIASDPTGIYAIVDKVVLEPNDTVPETIQIWGAFALADDKPGDSYRPAERGYLYYSLPSSQAERDTARAEWADLKKIAGSEQAIAFGSRYRPKGRVRKATEKPAAPDVYPIQMGIVKLRSNALPGDLIKQLRDAK